MFAHIVGTTLPDHHFTTIFCTESAAERYRATVKWPTVLVSVDLDELPGARLGDRSAPRGELRRFPAHGPLAQATRIAPEFA